MVDLSFVFLDSLVWWDIRLRCKTDTWNEPSCVALCAIFTLDKPLSPLLVKLGAFDSLVELGMARDIEFLVKVLKVAAQFFPTWVALFELEIAPYFFVEELVDGSIGVDTGTGIAVLYDHSKSVQLSQP